MKSEVTVYTYDRNDNFWSRATFNPEHIEFPGGEVQTEVSRLWIDDWEEAVIDLRFADADGLIVALSYADALRRVGFKTIHLFCPYLPAARQDRYEEGRSLSAKLYADLINSGNFASVICVDPHSDVMPALINNCVRIPIEDVFPRSAFPGPDRTTLVVPDQGAGKRVEAVVAKHGYRIAYARKHRDPKTGKLSGFQVEPIYTQQAIIVDDICDGGGTFLGLAEEMIKTQKQTLNSMPHLHLWVTHGIFSKGPWVFEGVFSTVATTDSFPATKQTDSYKVSGFELTRVSLLDTLKSVFTRGLA